MLFSTVCLDVYIFFGVQLWKNWAFHHPSIQFYISFHITLLCPKLIPKFQKVPYLMMKSMKKRDCAFGKTVGLLDNFVHYIASSANIPPRSPDIVPPVIDNSDEQCKPLQMPRPIKL